MGERRREALLLCKEDMTQWCEFINSLKVELGANFADFNKNNGKRLIAAVSEVLQELDHTQFNSIWSYLSKLSFEALECICNSVISGIGEEQVQMEKDNKSSTQVLEATCIILLASVRLEEQIVTNEMLQVVKLLHGSVFDLHEICPSLASYVCIICVEWWKKELRSREHLCLNVITQLLKMFSHFEKQDKLSAICSMQECLSLFDFKRKPLVHQDLIAEDATSESTYAQSVIAELRQMLLINFQNPLFMKDASGRKFLSSTMLLHQDLMKDAHQLTMDSILHKFNVVKAKALGNVYFHSWRSAGQEMKEIFEEICIQDLMFRAVHAPRAKDQNLFTPLQTMLFPIVCHKGGLEVRHMITRLYTPIIWRSLKANNAMVRANASNLLLDAFPMEEADSNQPRVAENEEFMQRQYEAMNNMLMDSCPRIRVIGITGLCEVLHMYWDAIPAHVIAILARKLYNDLAFDATVDVRWAVFKATITLLDAPCAHPLLAKLLPPCIEKCLHDVSEKVRVAVAEVLLAVKQTSTISFWSVCPVQNIIAQLEIDGLPVSNRLVKLLFRSFVPEDKPVQTWVERCVNFYKREVNAARKFYSLIDKELTMQEIGSFLNMIGIFVYNAVARALQQENTVSDTSQIADTDTTNASNMSTLSHFSIESDMVAALLDTSCILWKSLDCRISSSKLAGKNRKMMKNVLMTFSQSLHVCLKVANDERTLNAILLLSSNLPPASLPVFSISVLPKLRSLSDDSPSSYYGMLIKCVCSWDWSKQLLTLIYDWLNEAVQEFDDDIIKETNENSEESSTRRSVRLSRSNVSETENNDEKTKKKKKKTVMFTEKQELRPQQALKYLSAYLEVQLSCSFSVLDKKQCLGILFSISKTLQKCQVEVLKRSSSSLRHNSKTWSDSLLLEAVTRRCNLISVIHLHQKSKDTQDSDGETVSPPKDIEIEEFKYVVCWFNDILKQYHISTEVQADLNTSVLTNKPSSSATTLLSRLSMYRQTLNSTLSIFLDFLSSGVDVFDEIQDSLQQFCSSGVNLMEYINNLMKLLLQIDERQLLIDFGQSSDKNREEDTLTYDNKGNIKMIEIFDNIITSLLQHARQNPDSFMQIFRQNVRQSLRNLVHEQKIVFHIYPKRVWYDVMLKKTVSAVVVDLFHEIRSSQYYTVKDQISELPSFSASVLSVICATSAETAFVCENIILPIAKEACTESTEQKDQTLQPFAYLLHTLAASGKNATAAQECIKKLSQEVEGFKQIFSKVKSTEVLASNDDESNKERQMDDEDDAAEENQIKILEKTGNTDLFMNDEDFVI